MGQRWGGVADSSNCVPQVTQIAFTFKAYRAREMIRELFRDGKAAAHLVAHQSGAFILGIDGTPGAEGLGQQGAVADTENFGMALKFEAAGGANPGFCDYFVTQDGLAFVINFMPDYDPEAVLPLFFRGERSPMGNGDILHPAHVGDVIDVLHAVNIGWHHGDGEFKDFHWQIPSKYASNPCNLRY